MFFGPAVWDPWLILSQMLVLQCSFYIVVGVWLTLLSIVFSSPLSSDYIFEASTMCIHSVVGLLPLVSFIFVVVPMSYIVSHVVVRARKCLDFVTTVYFYHFLFCWIYGGLPKSLVWWIVNTIACTVTTVVSEYICLKREMQDIPRGETELEAIRISK